MSAREFRRQRRLAVPGDRLADVAQRITGDLLDVFNLVGGQAWSGLDEAPGQFALERDDRQAVPEQIVKVAREPKPFLPYRETGDLLASLRQLPVSPDQELAGNGRQADEQLIKELTGGVRNRLAARQLDGARKDGQQQDRRQADSPVAGGPRHDQRVQKEASVLGRGAQGKQPEERGGFPHLWARQTLMR